MNDSLGHDIGDQLLFEIGRRLAACVGPEDTVARLSGDEFAIIWPGLRSEESVALLARQLLSAVSEPLQVASHEFYPTCSIGVSLYPRDGRDCPTLLKNADTAMYRAKDSGRNNFQFYAHAMNAQVLERLKLESGLQRALERGEFRLHYQPQMDFSRGRLMGVEALLRWQPPDQSNVPPANFIPIAEETGLILPIGEWALRHACAQYKTWQSHSDLSQLRIAVNLSARQFKQQDIVKVVSRALADTDCPASALELEITESVLMSDPEEAAYTMRQLADMGVQLSIDDFGTGYSSLNYLKRLPIHALKIDRSFVRGITTDADDAAIAKAVIALAHSLKLSVIAEGVETLGQRDFLFHQRCDKMQGHLIGRPLTNNELEQQFAAYDNCRGVPDRL